MQKLTLAVAATLASLGVSAADPGMRPGQYAYTIKMEIPGMPFQMPPMSAQHCLTQADLDEGRQYQGQQSADCRTKNLQQSPGKATMEFACKDGTTGSGEYVFGNDTMTGKTLMAKDGATTTMSMTAKRTGDCRK